MVTIGVKQSLSNSAMYEHRYLENIKTLYKNAVKCDNQQKYKSILGATMFSTPEGGTVNSPFSLIQYVNVKISSARKLLR